MYKAKYSNNNRKSRLTQAIVEMFNKLQENLTQTQRTETIKQIQDCL